MNVKTLEKTSKWFQYQYSLNHSHKIQNLKPNRTQFFDSIENQYDCLGIDDHESKKYIKISRENALNWENHNYLEDWGNPQDQSNLLLDFGGNKFHDPFNSYNELPIQSKLPYLKHKEAPSEDIIVVNDSDNEIIVPHEMEVQHLDKSEDDFAH